MVKLSLMCVDNLTTIILQPQTLHLLHCNYPSKVLYQIRQQQVKSIFQGTFTDVV